MGAARICQENAAMGEARWQAQGQRQEAFVICRQGWIY